MAGRTTLLIAHRPSPVAHADRIIVIAHGRVAGQGPHRERIPDPEGISGKRYGRMFAALASRQTGK